MKKSIFTVAVAAAVLGLSFQASASITNTKHNLSSSWNDGGGMDGVNGKNRIYSSDNPEICIYCHTPHNAIKNDNIPLWNHQLSEVGTYGIYTSPTFDGSASAIAAGDLGTLNAAGTAVVSNLCLSCHDGTIAINSVNNPSNATPTITMVAPDGNPTGLLPDGSGQGMALGADWSTNIFGDGTLQNDHPVNFSYIEARLTDNNVNGGLVDPVDNAGTGLDGPKLFNGFIQCPSCHDPHNSDPDMQPFLRAKITGSELCLACHAK